LCGNAQIAGSGLQIRVPQYHLNRAQINTGFELVRGEAVSKDVRRHVFVHTCSARCILAQGPDRFLVHRVFGTLLRREEPRLRFAPPPVNAQSLEQNR
jgi:hypothetical protein